LRPNSLEDLQPEYKLEGLRAVLSPGPVAVTAVLSHASLPLALRTFSQNLIAGRAAWTVGGGAIGLTALRAIDDTNSVGSAVKAPLSSDVAGADLDLPIWRTLALVGELAYSVRDDNLRIPDPILKDYGVLAGIRLGDRSKRDFQLTYIQTNPDFNPLFRALSYARDRKGVRASLALRQMGPRMVRVQLFGKYLKEIKAMDGAEFTGGRYLGSYTDVAGSLRCEPVPDLTVGVEGEWRTARRQDDALTFGFDEKLGLSDVMASAVAIFDFVDPCNVLFKYTLAIHREEENAYHGRNNYISHTPSIEVAVKF
jgi:hypothetical protein